LVGSTRKQNILLGFLLFLAAGAAGGCQKDQEPQPGLETEQSHTSQQESTVIVPLAVKNAWKAVRIAVLDKAHTKETTYIIPIGGTFPIPGSSMTIEVETFLPAFVIEGAVMTSHSNEPKNPAAKIKIKEHGAIVFNGWLFARFPTTHAFMHPNYGFTLVDAIPGR
jgi:hypothetical protein